MPDPYFGRHAGTTALPEEELRILSRLSLQDEVLVLRDRLRVLDARYWQRALDVGAIHRQAITFGLEPAPTAERLSPGPHAAFHHYVGTMAAFVRAAYEAYSLAARGKARVVRVPPHGRTAVEVDTRQLSPAVAFDLEFVHAYDLMPPKLQDPQVQLSGPFAVAGAVATRLLASPAIRQALAKGVKWLLGGAAIWTVARSVDQVLEDDAKRLEAQVLLEAIKRGLLGELSAVRDAEAKKAQHEKPTSTNWGGLALVLLSGVALVWTMSRSREGK